MAGSKVLLNYINSYIDDTQQDRADALLTNIPQQYDMQQLQKYRLLDRSPEGLVTDDTPRRGVQSMSRPLEMREYGNKSKLAPYLSEVCLQDREKDPRGTETHPQMSKMPLYALQKGQWIKNNLYKDAGLQQVGEQIQHLKVVQNKQESDKRMREYLKVFSDERSGAANQRQFNPQDLKSGNRLALQQQEQDDSKPTPVQIGAPNKPLKRVDFSKVEEGAQGMVSRTEPNHIEQVGDRSQLIYSNPVFDPAERASQRGEMFTNNKTEVLQVLQTLDDRDHLHRNHTGEVTFAQALIDESSLNDGRQDATLHRQMNRGAAQPLRADDGHFDQHSREQQKAVIKRYKELQNKQRDPNAQQYEIDQSREKLTNAIAAVKTGKRRGNGKREHLTSNDRSFVDVIKGIVGIKAGRRKPAQQRADAKHDQTQTAMFQNPINQRKGKTAKGMIPNPIAHEELRSQIDAVNLQYESLSQEGKSLAYRLSAVFVPAQASPAVKLQVAEEILEMVARNRLPRSYQQTLYDPHASEQDIEQLAIVVNQTIVPRLKQKLAPQDLISIQTQTRADHVTAFQQLQGVDHSSSAFAFFSREALQSKKTNQRKPIQDNDRGDAQQSLTIRNNHAVQDVGFTQRLLSGGGQMDFNKQSSSIGMTNALRSGGDKKEQRRFVQFNSILQDSEQERTL